MISFLMPCYAWAPSGGFRVVYEYANRLTLAGHRVAVVHPRKLVPPVPDKFSVRGRLRKLRLAVLEATRTPQINWHKVDPRVQLSFVPSSRAEFIPQADVLFATGWHTVPSVLDCPDDRGIKCYFIQSYETWQGPREIVDATWRSDLRKVVVSKWLVDVGESLGCRDVTYIPNAIDHSRYKLIHPIEGRPTTIAMMCALSPLKGAADGIEAMRICRHQFPSTQFICFGITPRPKWVPEWVTYYRDPSQDFLIREIYNNSAIFLSASWLEGFALPPAEAAACGCALVSTDSGGVRDFIVHGVSGLLSPPKEPRSLADNLCLLLGNDDLRMRLARAGHGAVQKLTWDWSAQLMLDFLTKICKGTCTEQR